MTDQLSSPPPAPDGPALRPFLQRPFFQRPAEWALAHPRLSALLAGLASALGFAPVGFWPITLAAFVLFLALLLRAPSQRSAFFIGWFFGLGHFTLGLNWIAQAFSYQSAMPHWLGYAAVPLLSLYLAVYPGISAALCWRWTGPGARTNADRPGATSATAPIPARTALPAAWRLPLGFAIFWGLSEYLRATLFTGFAWNPLGVIWVGHPPFDMPQLAALARWTGTYGLGALTALMIGALYLLCQRPHRRTGALMLGAVALPMALAALLTPAPADPLTGFDIRVVQPGTGQHEKNAAVEQGAREDYEARNFARLSTLTTAAPRAPLDPASRLVFWPEDAIPAFLDMEPEWRARLAALLRPNDLLLTGGAKLYYRKHDRGIYIERELVGANNSLWVLAPDARLLDRYDKAHLVPYGEYLPLRWMLTPLGLSRLVPGDADYWPGPGPRTLTLPQAPDRPALRLGGQICYEIIFSGQVVDPRHRPDFLFNPSNDAWFGGWGPPQHLAQARLRAIEEGLPVIRSTPTGISALIDAQGRLLRQIGLGTAGYFDASLPPPAAPTLFARLGNHGFVALLALLALPLLIPAIASRLRRR